MQNVKEMTLEELLEMTGETLAEALDRSLSIADLVSLEIAFDSESVMTQMRHDAVVGKLIRESLESYLVARVEDMDEPEEMRGNFSYDAIAKDRASGY